MAFEKFPLLCSIVYEWPCKQYHCFLDKCSFNRLRMVFKKNLFFQLYLQDLSVERKIENSFLISEITKLCAPRFGGKMLIKFQFKCSTETLLRRWRLKNVQIHFKMEWFTDIKQILGLWSSDVHFRLLKILQMCDLQLFRVDIDVWQFSRVLMNLDDAVLWAPTLKGWADHKWWTSLWRGRL